MLKKLGTSNYFGLRKEKLSKLNPWPFYQAPQVMPPQEFVNRFQALNAGEWKQDPTKLLGRIMSKREASKSLIFLDVYRQEQTLQVMLRKNDYQDTQSFQEISQLLAVGDVCGNLI